MRDEAVGRDRLQRSAVDLQSSPLPEFLRFDDARQQGVGEPGPEPPCRTREPGDDAGAREVGDESFARQEELDGFGDEEEGGGDEG